MMMMMMMMIDDRDDDDLPVEKKIIGNVNNDSRYVVISGSLNLPDNTIDFDGDDDTIYTCGILCAILTKFDDDDDSIILIITINFKY